MKVDPSLAQRDKLRARIRGAGLRCTPARLAVLSELSRSARPLTHADLASAVAEFGFDRTTVYRNLVEMAEAGILSRIELGDHVWRFELRGNGQDHAQDHPHFLCTECGEVSCLSGVQVSIKPARGAKRGAIGKITNVLLSGRCRQCG